MLKTFINKSPPTKFLLIQDTLEDDASDLLHNIILNHANKQLEVHYLIFKGRYVSSCVSHPKVKNYDFTSDVQGWFSNQKPNLNKIICDTKNNFIFVVDSLSHMILEFGDIECYSLINTLLRESNVIQIVSLMHTDLIDDTQILTFFQHLSTLCIIREPQVNSDKKRVSYTYKKSSGKIVQSREEYCIKNGQFRSEIVKSLKPDVIVEQNISQKLPEDLTTFRLSLDDKEKEARDKVVLPYLPKEIVEDKEKSGGKIIYKFDEIDDWDEEDPDDDLNI